MLSAAETLEKTLALMAPTGIETVPLAHAAGRVLAQTIYAQRNQPPFDASAMDGYAVRADEATLGASLTVVGEVPAGGAYDGDLPPASAIRIFTGAPLPTGADAILIQEDTTRTADALRVDEAPPKGAHIRPAGLDFQAGARLQAPRRLTSAEIALAAAMNAPMLEVHRRPKVSLIATGDELVSPGGNPGPSQIISSNNYGLAAMLEAAGADPIIHPIAGDNRQSLTEALESALSSDLIITLGGASVGDYDLVRDVFGDGGLDLSFYKVAMRPGKPLMAGRVRGVPMIGLPGNPVSSMVLGHLILRPAMDALQGLPATALPRRKARLAEPLGQNGPREHYMRARLEETEHGLLAFPYPTQDSSMLSILAAANGLIVHPPKAEPMAAGETIDAIFF